MDVAVFQICSGAKAGRLLNLPIGSFSIGRAPTCNLRVQSDAVSRLHCELRIEPTGIVVRDLRSRNGTFLNGCRIEEAVMLSLGDHLRVGGLELRLVGSHGEAEPNKSEPALQPAPVDPSHMTLDELVQFDEDPLSLESKPTVSDPSQLPSDKTIGNFGTTILKPGHLNPDASQSSTSQLPSELVDTTQQAARAALRKLLRGKS